MKILIVNAGSSSLKYQLVDMDNETLIAKGGVERIGLEVHCTEGKDRAGFTSMLLAALMGGSVEEIVADYMTSYVNYYGIDPVAEADKYNMIAEKNVMDMLRVVCGLEKNASLEGVDLAAAAEAYLLKHGMTAEAIAALKANLQ